MSNIKWEVWGVIAFIVVVGTLMYFTRPQLAVGSAPSGIAATIASTSKPTLTAVTAVGLFATSSCSSRIVTTMQSAIRLTFSDVAAQTPTGNFGELQAASTTVAYDGGIYGCGYVKAFSYTTQDVTLTEVR